MHQTGTLFKINPSGKVTKYYYPAKLIQRARRQAEKNRIDDIRQERIDAAHDLQQAGYTDQAVELIRSTPYPRPGYKAPRIRKKEISPRSKNKVYDAMSLLYNRKRGRAVFLYTFTLPTSQVQAGLSDIEVGRKFSKFLNNLRTNYNLKNYVWISEVQTKSTGNLHYHLVTDTWLNPLKLSVMWEKYFRLYWGRKFRNSVQRDTCYNIKQLRTYLTKYITKQSEGPKARVINSRRVGRSEGLSDAPIYRDADELSEIHLIKIWQVCRNGRIFTGFQFDFNQVINKFFQTGAPPG